MSDSGQRRSLDIANQREAKEALVSVGGVEADSLNLFPVGATCVESPFKYVAEGFYVNEGLQSSNLLT